MPDTVVSTGLFDRALRRVTALWRDVAGGEQAADLAEQMQACLAGRGGEVSARGRAASLAQAYLGLDAEGRRNFLATLASFDSDLEAASGAWAKVAAATTPAERAVAKARLRRALEPPRLKLLTQFTGIPDGVKFLVDLRAELMTLMADDPQLQALEADLRGLLASWFDLGFLELRRVDWSSPASMLEKLVQYEAVHRIRSWRDLKNRLDSDRRCYAFFHPRMPDEPLIFVEVALVKGMADSVQRLLDEKAPVLDPREADTAVFYSINNCQRGLDGISFGNFLIKRVVTLLSGEFANLKTFATLSPIPGFRRWLEERVAAGDPSLVTEEEGEALREALPEPALPQEPPADVLLRAVARRAPLRADAVSKLLEPLLLRAAARYLLLESGRGAKRARDPVGHFHLSNGARVERLNWRGDTSEKGMREACGLMVNYLYDPARIEEYHEDYAGEGKRAAAPALRKLAR
jgi:malonyl-CoA decarboxylase